MMSSGISRVFLTALFCILPVWCQKATPSSRAVDFKTRNFNTIQAIYDFAGWGNSTTFLKKGISAIPPGLFNVNATGRVGPVGNFSGIEETSEYFFGLGPQAEKPFYIAWTHVDVVNFQSECPEVATSKIHGRTTIVHPGSPDDGKYVTTLQQTASWRFDKTGAVIAYDAVLPQLGLWFSKAYGVDFSDRAVQMRTIDALCQDTQRMCKGPNKQYDSVEQCIIAHASGNFGSYDEIWGDNVVCRTIHVILTKLRPDIHCPHVGPSGGKKCVNIDYNEYYFDDITLWGANDTFKCPQKS